MRLQRRMAKYQQRMERHQLRMLRHQRRHRLRMLKHQQRLNRVLGRGPSPLAGVMSRAFGAGSAFGPGGLFSHSGPFGHRGVFGHYGIAGRRGALRWRRRRRILPVLLGLALVGIAAAWLTAKGERPGNWI